jgi:hypothetical protein
MFSFSPGHALVVSDSRGTVVALLTICHQPNLQLEPGEHVSLAELSLWADDLERNPPPGRRSVRIE